MKLTSPDISLFNRIVHKVYKDVETDQIDTGIGIDIDINMDMKLEIQLYKQTYKHRYISPGLQQ